MKERKREGEQQIAYSIDSPVYFALPIVFFPTEGHTLPGAAERFI